MDQNTPSRTHKVEGVEGVRQCNKLDKSPAMASPYAHLHGGRLAALATFQGAQCSVALAHVQLSIRVLRFQQLVHGILLPLCQQFLLFGMAFAQLCFRCCQLFAPLRLLLLQLLLLELSQSVCCGTGALVIFALQQPIVLLCQLCAAAVEALAQCCGVKGLQAQAS